MTTRPKYRAIRPFSVGGVHHAEGDPVTGAPLQIVLGLSTGDQFVEADTARTRKPVDESATDKE